MSSTTVLLIRHAAHDAVGERLCGRLPGYSLGATGRDQAARLATALGTTPIAAIYTSPLERTRETANPLAAATAIEAVVDDDLVELDYGAWAGRTFASLASDLDWSRWNSLRLHTRPPGGESLLEAQTRIVGFLLRAAARRPHGVVAAVSHADVIKAALCWALGLTLESWSRFEISPASVSRIVIGDWGAKVWSLNEEWA